MNTRSYISSKGQLTSLDVSKNTALVTLRCSNAQLNVLDVSKNKALVTLDCSSNKLTKLDISKNTKLTSLSCSNNYLTKLDITKNTALTSLACTSNSLSTLNISKNKLLTKVSCSNNSLTKLDVTKNTSLTSLLCGNNKLTKIDLTQNIKLISLDCSYNELTKLNVTKNVYLISLKCQNNQLTKLDVSKNNDLTILRCDHNQFSTLDFTNNPALTSLHCEYNQLKKLNLSRNTFLTDLRCQNNQLTQLDVTNNKNLITLYCHNNHLKKLDFSKNTKLEFDSWSDYIQQQITGLKITQDKNYLFYVNLKSYLSNEISKIKSVEATNNYTAELVEYNATTGIAKFNYLPTGIYYEYDTGNAACMRVKLSPASEPVIATKYLPEALYEKSYRVSLKATGSTPISWTYSGKLPEGLSLSSEGRITGHPTTSAVTSEFTVIASNDSGMASQKLKIIVPTKPKIVGKFKDGNIKNPYSSEIKLSNGTSPYNWILTGTLPKGLKLQKSGNKAILTGIPSKNGTYGFKLKVIDKYEFSDERAFSIVITKPTIGGSLASNGIVKKSYSSTLSINGGTSSYKWTKSSGTLPAGLTLNPNSTGTKLTIKGTPTTAKAYTFTLKATDKNGATASKKFTVTITKPTISGTLTASGVIKKSYTGNLTVSKGTSPYTWSVSFGKLPDGVTMTQNSTGSKVTLRGKPTKTGKFTFTLKVVDKNKAAASQKCTIIVKELKNPC